MATSNVIVSQSFEPIRTKNNIGSPSQTEPVDSIYEPAHEIMVLITQATSEGSGEPAHPRSLARAFAVRSHEVGK